jgi:hypothetical protein
MDDDLRNAAVLTYFVHRATGVPGTRPQALIELFGPEQGAALREYVEAVCAEAFRQHAGADLGESTRRMMETVGAVYPELPDEALKAVGAFWSYSWR